jgi:hypothetical protein
MFLLSTDIRDQGLPGKTLCLTYEAAASPTG